jgi:hypothetical protein
MFKGVFVPNTLLIEDKNLFRLTILEHHFLIEDVTVPHQIVCDDFRRHFLEVLDIHNVFTNTSKHLCLVEYYLLSVWKQLCVPAKV